MYPHLRGSQVPAAKTLTHPISENLRGIPGFHDLNTYYPGMKILTGVHPSSSDVWFDHRSRVIRASHDSIKASGRLNLRIERNVSAAGQEIQDISGFRKITHLLDPVRWIQGKYMIPKGRKMNFDKKSWGTAWEKIKDPMNQAYIEALASYAFGKIRENDLSPHFHLFYGSFSAKADTYAYNITDSFLSYRHCRWFWTSQENKVFSLGFDDDIPEEVKSEIITPPEDFDSTDEEDEDEELDSDSNPDVELGSLHSASGSDIETASEDDEEDEDEEEDNEITIYAEIQDFPVMMIYTEASEGTMDTLLDNYDQVGSKPGSELWEATWKAWIFQTLAALSLAQSIFGFTHNDLHTNNIVWSTTKTEYLYYSTKDGVIFKVPTYGKLFKIIDFGRSIFRVNDKFFFSDDFKEGNDAADQYFFKELEQERDEDEVVPNPSFDLCRFTVSVFESLFPSTPTEKKDGGVLSNEPGLIIKETDSTLYNLLWSWLLCDDGHNVLMNSDGSERYPDFDLYKVIAAQVHGAIPSEQIRKPLFEIFHVEKENIPLDTKVYSLYC